MLDVDGKRILITGGTGSFGQAFVRYLLGLENPPAKITVFSRDEQKQHAMAVEFRDHGATLRYVLGDVRDGRRIDEATAGHDIVIHSAAMKHVPAAEANPMECVKTNILGSQNVIDAAKRHQVERVVALSTDKAALPANFYGASKLCLEKLFTHADAEGDTRLTAVRYANVFGSKGSVVPLFLKLREQGYLPITHEAMTRFSITMQGAIDLVVFALSEGWGGEVIVPVAPSYRIVDVARAVSADAELRTVGIRPGEKLHEVMFTRYEAPNTVRRGAFYVVCPQAGRYDVAAYAAETLGELVPSDFEYSSNENDTWLAVEDIKRLIEQEIILA